MRERRDKITHRTRGNKLRVRGSEGVCVCVWELRSDYCHMPCFVLRHYFRQQISHHTASIPSRSEQRVWAAVFTETNTSCKY